MTSWAQLPAATLRLQGATSRCSHWTRCAKRSEASCADQFVGEHHRIAAIRVGCCASVPVIVDAESAVASTSIR